MRTAERSGSASWQSVPALVGILAGPALVIVPVAIGLSVTAATAGARVSRARPTPLDPVPAAPAAR